MNSMDGPQYALARAIVEHGRLRINGYDWVYPDFALVDGQMYSKRSPGVSFIAVPCYFLSRSLAPYLFAPYYFVPQATHGINADSPVEAMTYGLVSLIGAADVALCYLIMRQLDVRRGSAVVAALLFGFGSLLWSYATSLVREPAVIFFLLFAFLCVLKLAQRSRMSALFGTGIALGLALFCDNLALFPASVLLGAAAWTIYQRRELRALAMLGLACVISVLPLCSYNTAVFGQPFAIQYLYDQNPLFHHRELHTLANLTWSIPVNLFSVGPIPVQAIPYVGQYHLPPQLSGFGVQSAPMTAHDQLLYDWDQANSGSWATHMTYKGIVTQSPVLVLVLVLAWTVCRRNRWYGLTLLTAAAFFLPLCKISYFYNPNNFDTRYFLPATAFLFLPLGASIDWLRAQRGHWIRGSLLGVTTVLAVVSLLSGWEGVLQNYAPHVTGQNRSTLWTLIYPGVTVTHPWRIVLVHTFPNSANLLFLLPMLIVVLACAAYLNGRLRRRSVHELPGFATMKEHEPCA